MAVKASAQVTIYYVVDVKATYRYYLLQSSTLSTPSKPTTHPPASTWDDTEPSYVAGSTNSLYFVDCTIFNDDTFKYSEVSKSTSYEAAKAAYNKAVNAESTANSANNKIDNLEIGARNLLPDTDFNGETNRYERLDTLGSEGGFHYYPTIDIESGVEYTLSAEIRGKANIIFYQICSSGGNHSTVWIQKSDLSETDYRRFELTFTVDTSRVFQDVFICTQYGDANTLVGDWFEIKPKSLKLEKGNHATDWSPAPEDFETKITDTKTDILSDNEQILMEVLANYVESNDYETWKGTVDTQLQAIPGSIELSFTNTKSLIDAVDKDLQEKYNTITTYFNFGENGLEIGKSDSPYKVVQSNEKYSMQVNGVEILWLDATTKSAYIPILTITERLTLMGYLIDLDASGNLNCEYVGGE